MVVTGLKDVYLWHTDSSLPIKVGNAGKFGGDQYRHPRWSPDSRSLAFVTDDNGIGPVTAHVVNNLGHPLADFQIGGGTDGEDIRWLANDVICRDDRNSSPCHKASTGQHLFDLQGWHILTAGGILPQQAPGISPDQRWILLDHSYADSQAMVGDRATIRAAYFLYDVQGVSEYALPNSGSNPLVFAGWKADSSVAYLISRSRQADSLPMPDTPFGLLAFDAKTRRLELLFKEAMYVGWSPSQEWAFVMFPARNDDGILGLNGGVWEVGTETMVSRVLVSKEMIYADPGWDAAFRGPGSFGAPVWSHDNRWVAFGDAHGKLYLSGVDGIVVKLASDESGASWLGAEITWSPDDGHLLVQYGDRAWIVSVP